MQTFDEKFDFFRLQKKNFQQSIYANIFSIALLVWQNVISGRCILFAKTSG